MSLDDLIDSHTGHAEWEERKKRNFARHYKALRKRRLEKRRTLIDVAAHEKAKKLHSQRQKRDDRAGQLNAAGMFDLGRCIIERQGCRGASILVNPRGGYEWSDFSPDGMSGRYVELPEFGSRGVNTRRFEILDRWWGRATKWGLPHGRVWILGETS